MYQHFQQLASNFVCVLFDTGEVVYSYFNGSFSLKRLTADVNKVNESCKTEPKQLGCDL